LTIPRAGQLKKTANLFLHVPDTVSREFRGYLRKIPDPALPAPEDIEAESTPTNSVKPIPS